MIFSLDVLRARKGDCLLLHYGPPTEPGLVMIDGGPKDVYKPHLRPRLMEIRKGRRLDSQEPLLVDLLMVSHVDDDHIQGILDLTRELIVTKNHPCFRVLGFWHNSFDEIIGDDPKELTASIEAQFGSASLNGDLPADATVDAGQMEEETIVDNLKVLASIAQGFRLRTDAEGLGFDRNPEFGGKLILAGKKKHPMGQGLKFVVAGPMKPELQALQKKHDKWLKDQKKKKKKKEDGEAALAAYVDDSVPNLSSVVVLAQGDGKSMLLTGDARGDKILKGLELAGVLKKGGTMHVNVLKVPHHGSARNLEDDFFERITADHYVFSGNGEHGNPERETLEMLFKARGRDPFEIHLTYPVDEIDVEREADWKKEQAKAKAKGKKPKPDWSPQENGLVAFFENQNLVPGQNIRIKDAAKPHVIDLLDPLGY